MVMPTHTRVHVHMHMSDGTESHCMPCLGLPAATLWSLEPLCRLLSLRVVAAAPPMGCAVVPSILPFRWMMAFGLFPLCLLQAHPTVWPPCPVLVTSLGETPPMGLLSHPLFLVESQKADLPEGTPEGLPPFVSSGMGPAVLAQLEA